MHSYTRSICRIFVEFVKCLYGRQICTSILEKRLLTYHCKLFESACGETRLKMGWVGWVVKKSVLSLLTALILAKMHSCSKLIYFTINIY